MTSRSFGGPWTQEKLDILHLYLDAYTTALKSQPFSLIYVDGFAGAGSYSESGDDYAEFHELRQGSTRIALGIDNKPFDRVVFIEADADAATSLLQLANEYPGRDIQVIQGDANVKVPEFCRSMGDFDRSVVFLDPYATELFWPTVEAIAATEKIDCWILFPRMAITRMMPNDKEPNEATSQTLDRVFGDRESWQESYRDSSQMSLFADDPTRERELAAQIAARYKRRLMGVFQSVAPASRTLRNSKNVPLFELFFAAGNPKGAPIAVKMADHILTRL